ncbi:hypothetical protein C8R43DRAFT_957801 [Mycena crocata]|nr:hypothetical protein C8R43DRAFT_957801 [Mycena crocata]
MHAASRVRSSLRTLGKTKSLANEPSDLPFTPCDPTARTADIVHSSLAIEDLQKKYIETLIARRDELKNRCHRSEQGAKKSKGQDAAAEQQEETDKELILNLHAQLRNRLGDTNYNRMIESRGSVFKNKPRLPAHMNDLDDDALIELIHRPGPEDAEGSSAPIARAKKTAQKIRGGGGYTDKTPRSDEIGSG